MEINAECAWSDHCPGCVLQARQAPSTAMDGDEVRTAAREMLYAARHHRGLNLAGMEILSTPDRLFGVLADFHETPRTERPATINAVSSAIGLGRLIGRFIETPLSSLITSWDAEETGLRGSQKTYACAFADSVKLIEAGGAEHLAINTILMDRNRDSVLRIGGTVLGSQAVSTWYVGPWLAPINGRMTPTLSGQEMIDFAYRAADLPIRSDAEIHVDVGFDALRLLPGGEEAIAARGDEWRVMVRLPGTSVFAIGWNTSSRVPFMRLRWDGQILTHRDEFLAQGLSRAAAGRYKPGRLVELTEAWELQGQANTASILAGV
jgi:hypothetical protein